MSNITSAKTRSHRAASLKLPPGKWARTLFVLRQRNVLLRLGVCALGVVLLVLISGGWMTPFNYRSGYIPPHDILARADFTVTTNQRAEHHIAVGDLLAMGGRPLSASEIQMLYAEQSAVAAEEGVQEWLGRAVSTAGIYILLLAVGGCYLSVNHRMLIQSPGSLAMLIGSIIFVVALALLAAGDAWRAESIPLILFGLTLAVMFDRPLALLLAAAASLLVSLSLGYSLAEYLLLSMSVMIPTAMVHRVRSRTKLITVGILSGFIVFVSALCISGLAGQAFGAAYTTHIALVDNLESLTRSGFLARVAIGAGWYGLCVVLAGFFMTGLLPFFERAFDVQTDIRLLELGDAAHPLLQHLAQRAPGTYNHSINVASIGEAAAEAIHANGLLVRVGAYFHDIGKMFKPEYFIENQATSGNQHESLVPAMSTLVIIAHVKDGINLARQHRLPKSISDFIEQHHGTTLVEFFYRRAAKLQAENPNGDLPDESSFRYPGPKPQTRESAVLMMADAVESACRSLTDPTSARIESLVHEIAMKRLLDGQFDQCSLTLQDLNTMEESLVKSLTAVYHGRVKYPGQQTA